MFFPIYVYTFQQGIFLRFTLQTSSGIIQFGKAVHSLGRRQLKSGRMEPLHFGEAAQKNGLNFREQSAAGRQQESFEMESENKNLKFLILYSDNC